MMNELISFEDVKNIALQNQFTGFEVLKKSDRTLAFSTENPAFESNKLNDNLELLAKILSYNPYIPYTFVGWTTNAKTGKKYEYHFFVEKSEQQPQTAPVQIGYAPEDIDKRIATAVEAVKQEYREKEIERREQELKEREAEFRREKESALGIVFSRLGKVFNSFPQLKVAGADTQQELAERIQPSPVQDTDGQPADDQTADDQTNDIVSQLINTWYAADPECLQVMAKIVHYASTGEKIKAFGFELGYDNLKEFLLK